MPAFLIPARSSRHRTACFALYKALLRQVPKVPLADDLLSGPDGANPIKHLICRTFRWNRGDTSPRLISCAMANGYKFLDLLTKAQSPSSREHASVVSHLRGHLSRCAKQARRAPEPKPYSGPFPNTTPLLTRVSDSPPAYASTVRPRPQSQLKGTRHVPMLSCSAEKIPFLRIRKPIPAFLSRVIRQRGRKRNVRSSMLTEIEEEHEPFAAQEDMWERQVRRLLAEAKRPYASEAEDPPYSDSLWAAHDSIVDWLHADTRDLVARSDAMLQIVEDEQALAQKEREERRRASKQRWIEKQKTLERNPQGTGQPKK